MHMGVVYAAACPALIVDCAMFENRYLSEFPHKELLDRCKKRI
jgi:hypothetical protein